MTPTLPPPGDSAPAAQPKQIGPYQILDVLGEGGMGTVFLAEQQAPMKRRVALKLIKLGMDSKAVVARFEQERQALALMQHDGIARVHDCGTSERGQPYFVMELVKGIPLNKFCEQSKLSLPQRLRLMQQVCAAVQHAHQKGVVHRDLKPGNVLVSDDAGRLQCKIIDFGLAKSLAQRLGETSLFTEVGQVLGTPEYMAPEQADPDNADIDTRADIYSLGVMLYEVLVGSLPFPIGELRKQGLQQLQRVLREQEPPKPSTRFWSTPKTSAEVAAARGMSAGALRKALKNDLDWVVLKAMEKDRNRRYETANALSLDLQRFLDHEPLAAGPPSAGYRLKKFVRRYRGQVLAASAVLGTAVLGTAVATKFAITAAANETAATANEKLATDRAVENAQLAASEAKAKQEAEANATQLAAKVREFDQLAGAVLYERAIANESMLYPEWPSQQKAMEAWLEKADRLLAMKAGIAQTVRDLEARTPPPTAEEQEEDRRAHPRFVELQSLGERLGCWRRAQAMREGKATLVVPELSPAQQALDAAALNALAWPRVAAKADARRIWGEETSGLALAQAAAAKARGADTEFQMLDTLAWALFANGQDAPARAQSAAALAMAPDREQDTYRGRQRDLDAAIANAAGMLATTERQLVELTTAVDERRTFRFELESQRFLHDTLVGLLTKIDSLATNERVSVQTRLGWAKQIQGLSLAHPEARHTWAAVRAAIASNDKYAGHAIELRDDDVTGLVPIGENPVTKLWEFYDLRSAWDGKAEPRTIPIPVHAPDGSIEVAGESGIVFVLLSGGTFTMGAQKDDKDGPNFDPQAKSHEGPAHEVTLAPFFLARHELTQGQWARLWTGDPALRQPSQYQAGQSIHNQKITLQNPVEQVSWSMCDTLLSRHGLALPTEAQWDYACRGGTSTPWLCPLDDLQQYANLSDASVKAAGVSWTMEAWNDGHVVHAPVGSFAANNFGLHDVHGNVWEWCRDQFGRYDVAVRAGDGLRLAADPTSTPVFRGGSYQLPGKDARSVSRGRSAATVRSANVGVRAARMLQP